MKRTYILYLLGILMLTGCTARSSNLLEEMDEFNDQSWKKADGYSNGSLFNCTWREDNVSFSEGKMTLKIQKEPSQMTPAYSAGEYRSTEKFGYGLYTVRMKPAKNPGTVSSFFTYTGPSEDEPWDEIDIEFLGKDTSKVQFNYYTNGKKPSGEFLYDLGFDASQDYHEYGFNWQEDTITWLVDGKEVYTANKDIPTTPGRIMMNYWPGIGVDGWLSKYNGNTDIDASYDWVKYNPNP